MRKLNKRFDALDSSIQSYITVFGRNCACGCVCQSSADSYSKQIKAAAWLVY